MEIYMSEAWKLENRGGKVEGEREREEKEEEEEVWERGRR